MTISSALMWYSLCITRCAARYTRTPVVIQMMMTLTSAPSTSAGKREMTKRNPFNATYDNSNSVRKRDDRQRDFLLIQTSHVSRDTFYVKFSIGFATFLHVTPTL